MIINPEEMLMKEALKEAKKAFDENEIPVGAVVVHNGKVIARGYNQVERLKDVTAHAEMLAITSAADFIGGKYLTDCDLYVTLEPCIMCIGAIRHARFKKVVYGAKDNRHLMPGRWERLLQKTDVQGGVMEQACESLLQAFFQRLRDTSAG